METVLVTGGAGFIGFHTAKALLERGDSVIVVDNFNDYYDASLKEDRIKDLIQTKRLIKGDTLLPNIKQKSVKI